jgi:hypothetical protein
MNLMQTVSAKEGQVMRDYEELVKALRDEDNCNVLDYIDDAADAIEELQSQINGWIEQERKSLLKSVPRWVSVEERLPESGTHVLVCCRVKWLGGGHSYVCDAFHSNSKTIPCSYNDDIDMEYDEEKDEYYFPEGWWEVIKNWDEYSCVAIADFVTHWMPLPEPPKEEKECI